MNNETIEKELKKQTGEQREQNTNQVWPVLGYEFGFLCREGLPFAQKQPQEAKEGTERTQHPNAHTYKHMLACASIRCAMGNKGSQKQAVDAPVAESRDTAAMVSEAASVPLPASPRTSITNTSKPAKLDDSWIGVAVAVLHTCEIECMALSLSLSLPRLRWSGRDACVRCCSSISLPPSLLSSATHRSPSVPTGNPLVVKIRAACMNDERERGE